MDDSKYNDKKEGANSTARLPDLIWATISLIVKAGESIQQSAQGQDNEKNNEDSLMQELKFIEQQHAQALQNLAVEVTSLSSIYRLIAKLLFSLSYLWRKLKWVFFSFANLLNICKNSMYREWYFLLWLEKLRKCCFVQQTIQKIRIANKILSQHC